MQSQEVLTDKHTRNTFADGLSSFQEHLKHTLEVE